MTQLSLITQPILPPDEIDGRDPYDRYYTPAWASRVLLGYMGSRLSGSAWEPCAGAGHILDVLLEHEALRVIASDIAPARADVDQADFLTCTAPPVDWIVTNPPYSTRFATAADIIRRALDVAQVGVCALLRLSWLEPTDDRRDMLPGVTDVLVLPRVHYINAPPANPSTSIWLVWDKRRSVGAGAYRRVEFFGPEVRW